LKEEAIQFIQEEKEGTIQKRKTSTVTLILDMTENFVVREFSLSLGFLFFSFLEKHGPMRSCMAFIIE